MKTEHRIRVLMVAAENGALPAAKVGGMGDVLRDLAPELAKAQVQADQIMPAYGRFHRHPHASQLARLTVPFGGRHEIVTLYQLANPAHPESRLFVLDHPLFSNAGDGVIYHCNDPEPYASDASKFALFCAAVAVALCQRHLGRPEVLHLHDWHAALLTVLRAFDPRYQPLQALRCVYSIHNLALQGTRPFRNSHSSFGRWFPELAASLTDAQTRRIEDPSYPQCLNPMRAAINLADKVHLVSPSYASEVLQPSDHRHGIWGGEGLEQDLNRRHQQGGLCGILNGLVYPDTPAPSQSFEALLNTMHTTLLGWQGHGTHLRNVDFIAHTRLQLWQQAKRPPPSMLLTTVARLTEQKVAILCHRLDNGDTVLETLLRRFKQRQPQGLYVCLGSGNHTIEAELQRVAAHHDNFLFLNGYQEQLSAQLYRQGQLFMMPSSFEPCGISQLMAMREGQPCLVHAVGGLRDTVVDNQTGYWFEGDGLEQQGLALLARFDELLEAFGSDDWQRVAANAKEQRFGWQSPCHLYRHTLYLE
ncbi:glycogen synthase [Ferrimonas kyonanensis]|uniref:glycogen synthase n=1 Tax=Ferrimonas kyonanensis TaxID=364763 RepID=UPI001FE137EC|nr:glycogen/starch synthase [Ferrimonas kyonanensis]